MDVASFASRDILWLKKGWDPVVIFFGCFEFLLMILKNWFGEKKNTWPEKPQIIITPQLFFFLGDLAHLEEGLLDKSWKY